MQSRKHRQSQQSITETRGLTMMTNAGPYPQGNLLVAFRPPQGTTWRSVPDGASEGHNEADRHAALLWATKAAVAAFFDE